MKTFTLDQCSLPEQFSNDIRDNLGLLWYQYRTADFFRSVFATFANVVKFYQAKDKKRIGLTIKDDKGGFKFGVILVYRKPEDDSEEDSGNWYLQMTFNEDDMTDLDVSVDNHTEMFIRCAEDSAYHVGHGRFKTTDIMFSMYNAVIDSIYKFLDKNSNDGDVTLEFRGVFTASVTIEGDKKIFSIVPGEYIKQLIKEDAALQ